MAAASAYAHDRGDARIVFQTRPGAYNDESLIEFLQALHDELGGAKVTLIWDGLPSHRSRRMQAWIRSQRRWLVVKRLPGYAPTSTRSKACGATSKAPSWPTAVPTASTNRPTPPTPASTASAPTPTSPWPSCAAAGFRYDNTVTLISDRPQRPPRGGLSGDHRRRRPARPHGAVRRQGMRDVVVGSRSATTATTRPRTSTWPSPNGSTGSTAACCCRQASTSSG